MILKRLQIYNFILFDDVDIKLSPNTYFILGENRDENDQDSNGAGKSALVQSIVWALFDDTLRKGMLKDDVIGNQDEYCQVVVTFEKDGKEYVVDRVRNHPDRGNDVTISSDGDDGLTQHKNNVAIVEKILKINSDLFYHCCYNEEAAVKPPFASLTSTQMAKAVSEMLDINRFDSWAKKARAKNKDLSAELDKYLALIQAKQKEIAKSEKNIESLKYEIEVFDQEKESKIAAKTRRMESLVKQKQEIHSEVQQKISKAQEELSDIDMNVVKSYDDLREKKFKCEQEKEKLAQRLLKLKKKEKELELKNQEFTNQYNNLYQNDDGKCNYCGGLLTNSDDIAQITEEIRKKKDKVVEESVDLQVKIDIEKNNLTKKVKEIKDLDGKLDEITETKDKYSDIREEINHLERERQKVDDLSGKILDLKQRIDELMASKPKHLKNMLAESEEALEESEQEARDLLDQIDDVEMSIKAAKTLDKVFKKMRSSSLNTFIYRLNQNINSVLMDITDGDIHCSLEQNGNDIKMMFTSLSKDGRYLPFSCFSAGERTRIAKAVSIALFSMVEMGTLIDDEGMHGLDATGAVSIAEYMVDSFKDKVMLFVSHDQNLIDYFSDCPKIRVIKENGVSFVRLEV